MREWNALNRETSISISTSILHHPHFHVDLDPPYKYAAHNPESKWSIEWGTCNCSNHRLSSPEYIDQLSMPNPGDSWFSLSFTLAWNLFSFSFASSIRSSSGNHAILETPTTTNYIYAQSNGTVSQQSLRIDTAVSMQLFFFFFSL